MSQGMLYLALITELAGMSSPQEYIDVSRQRLGRQKLDLLQFYWWVVMATAWHRHVHTCSSMHQACAKSFAPKQTILN